MAGKPFKISLRVFYIIISSVLAFVVGHGGRCWLWTHEMYGANAINDSSLVIITIYPHILIDIFIYI